MIKGSFTALVTPFNGDNVDYEGLERLVDFQIKNHITGVLAVGTTGESPSLSWEEHHRVIKHVRQLTLGKVLCIAGTGSNNTREAMSATEYAVSLGVEAVLLVDPYYNGPSSLEIRKEYIVPIAQQFTHTEIIPYIIPARTGTQMMPQDLAILYQQFNNVGTVKEATGNLENMKLTRQCCGKEYSILSGDDGLTFEMMTNPSIMGSGVISVASNVAPRAVSEMVSHLAAGNTEKAQDIMQRLTPLFDLLMVKTNEKTPMGEVLCRARNPLPIKTLMRVLGMPSGGCRRPIGKMTQQGLQTVLNAANKIMQESPEIFAPAAEYFNIDIEQRLKDTANYKSLCYESY